MPLRLRKIDMAIIVYLLCGLTSLACALLLMRSYFRSRSNLLLYSGLCFVGLCLNNVILFIDLAILPSTIDLSLIRTGVAFFSMVILLYGLIWDTV